MKLKLRSQLVLFQLPCRTGSDTDGNVLHTLPSDNREPPSDLIVRGEVTVSRRSEVRAGT